VVGWIKRNLSWVMGSPALGKRSASLRARGGRAAWSSALAFALASSAPAPLFAEPREPQATPVRTLDIAEFRVEGADHLPRRELERAVYPFLGPGRTVQDVEGARVALEKAYTDRGFQAVAVAIPPQTVRDGVVALKVAEGTIARLRVRGSRWFALSEIKKLAPSMAEGAVPNFNDLARDIVALNQIPDRRVTPALKPGPLPGTIDVDLAVQDTFPLHGFIEVNNRFSANTTHTRLTGTLHYDNLWQLGHSLSLSFQVAPKRIKDAKVFSGSYQVRLPSKPWLSFLVTGVAQDSDISSLGTFAVAGRGWIAGMRSLFTLPGSTDFFHTVSAGIDFKRFLEKLRLGDNQLFTPIVYWPLVAQYGASWQGKSSQTQLALTLTANLRGLGNTAEQFDAKRYKAKGSFVHGRAELSRADELPWGMLLVAKAHGQLSAEPLVGSEQLVGGGADSARGYTEAQAAGDFGGLASVELRSPSLSRWLAPFVNDWRFHAFAEGGWMRIHEPLPEQQSIFRLWSAGLGSSAKLFEHFSGSLDVGVPLRSEGPTTRYKPRFHFRVSAEL
jgi:hemolysin activation/secretion protein